MTGRSEHDLRADADLALSAGARVLADLGQKTGARADDLASWKNAIEEMSGYADEPHREAYAHDVYGTLARGGRFTGRDGETIVLPAHHDLPPSLTIDLHMTLRPLAAAEYPGAEWIPTSCANSKCSTTRPAKVELILVHDTEGGWNASVATLQNDPGKSCHYIIGEDGRLGQFVTESTTAYHAGNLHYNQRSIGIEHVGYATKPFPEAEYAASAKLVDHLTTKYGIPRDRAHVIGHDQVPNGNRIASSSKPCADSPKSCQSNLSYGGASHHTDPGIWEWATYMDRFGGDAKCNDVTAIKNCSYDKSKAFRCVNGIVEVEACTAGCEVMPNGVDDVCSVTPTSTPPPPDPPKVATEAELPPVEAAIADDGGCAVGTPRGSSPTVSLVLFGLVVLARRRKSLRT
jgi:N-acetyl-anhydromuramyl-L-alanine amidase AmpD